MFKLRMGTTVKTKSGSTLVTIHMSQHCLSSVPGIPQNRPKMRHLLHRKQSFPLTSRRCIIIIINSSSMSKVSAHSIIARDAHLAQGSPRSDTSCTRKGDMWNSLPQVLGPLLNTGEGQTLGLLRLTFLVTIVWIGD